MSSTCSWFTRMPDIQDLAGLKGRTVLMYENSRTCLAPPWLDTILLEKGLPPASEHLGSVSQVKKLSGVVLPVFFRQADACVVTRRGLETLSELNPQVGSRASDPGLLTQPAAVRVPTSEPEPTQSLEGSLCRRKFMSLHMTASGKQLLNLFQADRLVDVPASEIDGARELLATHRRLMAKWEVRGPQVREPRRRDARRRRARTSANAAGGGGQ